MKLIDYSSLFLNPELYSEYQKSKCESFSQYAKKHCGLEIVYEHSNPNYKVKGFRIEDEKKWMLTKIKHGIFI